MAATIERQKQYQARKEQLGAPSATTSATVAQSRPQTSSDKPGDTLEGSKDAAIELPDITAKPKRPTAKQIKELAKQASTADRPDDLFDSRYFNHSESVHQQEPIDSATANHAPSSSAKKRKIRSYVDQFVNGNSLGDHDEDEDDGPEKGADDDIESVDEDMPDGVDDINNSIELGRNQFGRKMRQPTAQYMKSFGKEIHNGNLTRQDKESGHEKKGTQQRVPPHALIPVANTKKNPTSVQEKLTELHGGAVSSSDSGSDLDDEDLDILPGFLTNNNSTNTNHRVTAIPYEGDVYDEFDTSDTDEHFALV
jgi:hypothetical protein